MMTKTDYEIVGEALRDLPNDEKATVYRRLVLTLSERNPDFDPEKFGESMKLPPEDRLHDTIQE